MDSKQTTENQDACAGLAAATGSVVHGKTAQQWHDAWLLCATGRELEWEQLCYLTEKLSSAAQGLKDAAAHGNQAARRAYRKLNAATQYLWLQPAEKCAHKMPKQSLTGSRVLPSPDAKATQMVTADPGEAHPPNAPDQRPAAEPGLFGLCLCGSPLVMDGEHMICGAYRLKILADLKALPRRTAEEATRRQNNRI